MYGSLAGSREEGKSGEAHDIAQIKIFYDIKINTGIIASHVELNSSGLILDVKKARFTHHPPRANPTGKSEGHFFAVFVCGESEDVGGRIFALKGSQVGPVAFFLEQMQFF